MFALIELYRRPCKPGLTTKTLLVWFVIWFALLSVVTGFFLRTFGGNSLTRVWHNNLSTGIIIVAAALVIIWLSLLVAPSLATARDFLPTCYQAVSAACISFTLQQQAPSCGAHVAHTTPCISFCFVLSSCRAFPCAAFGRQCDCPKSKAGRRH